MILRIAIPSIDLHRSRRPRGLKSFPPFKTLLLVVLINQHRSVDANDAADDGGNAIEKRVDCNQANACRNHQNRQHPKKTGTKKRCELQPTEI